MHFFESLLRLKEKTAQPKQPLAEPEPQPEVLHVTELTMEQWLETHDTPHEVTAKINKSSSKKAIFGDFQEKLTKALNAPQPISTQPFEPPFASIEPSPQSEEPSIADDAEEFDWSEDHTAWNTQQDELLWFAESTTDTEEPTVSHVMPDDSFEETPFSASDSSEILAHINERGIMLKSTDFQKKCQRGVEGVYRSKGAVEKIIDLHGMAVRDAELKLIRMFDEAKVRGYQQLLIVHGRGNHSRGGDAKVKRMVIELLEGSLAARVSTFNFAPFNEGGGGATRVILK